MSLSNEDFKKALEFLTDFRKDLESANAAPAVGVEGQGTPSGPRYMTRSDQLELRAQLRTKSDAELHTLLSEQLKRKDVGIPLDVWAASNGPMAGQLIGGNDVIMKAVDSALAAPLIRQDLEPMLYELYIREFPAWERFPKEPANGLVHAWNQITSFGDAEFMSELGTVTDDKSQYTRKTTNVAIIATRRGVSLKSRFAISAGGMGWNLEQLELQGGLRAIAHRMQKTIFEGQATDSGGTSSNELGAFDPNAFDGLRSILNTARAQNADPTSGTPDDLREALDLASEEIVQAGGRASIIWCHPGEKVTFDLQQDKNVRYMNNFVNVAPGVLTNAVNTLFGPLPLAIVPGDSIGEYTAATYSSNTVRDMYVLDESTITIPFLGSEGPTVLDIPVGLSGQLTHLYIVFGMWGLAVKAIPFSNKVRIKQ